MTKFLIIIIIITFSSLTLVKSKMVQNSVNDTAFFSEKNFVTVYVAKSWCDTLQGEIPELKNSDSWTNYSEVNETIWILGTGSCVSPNPPPDERLNGKCGQLYYPSGHLGKSYNPAVEKAAMLCNIQKNG